METDVERQIKESLSQGERWNIIAKTLHVSNRTIAKVSKKMNEVTSSPPRISEVFTMFDQDISPMQIVKDYNADSIKIKQWFEDWLKMNKDWNELQEAKAKAEQEKARAPEKDDGGKAEKVEEKPRPDWREILKSEPPPFLRET